MVTVNEGQTQAIAEWQPPPPTPRGVEGGFQTPKIFWVPKIGPLQ